ncbi:MAG TPA: winged helix-turn-helix domain-containing protein [Pyrinomonadaceae bacterium]|nr:winged helix-turn-helix domain-containing protein [Pyrinomonadaceae bacterium]
MTEVDFNEHRGNGTPPILNEPKSEVFGVHIYEFSDFRMDTLDKTDHRLLCKGQPLHLPPKQFLLLKLLVQSHGQTVSTELLISQLWPEYDSGSATEVTRRSYHWRLDKQISLLKHTLDGGRDIIQRPRGEGGCRLAAVIKEVTAPIISPESYDDFKFGNWILFSNNGRAMTAFFILALMVSLLGFSFPGNWQGISWFQNPVAILCLVQFATVAVALIGSFITFKHGREFRSTNSTQDTVVMQASGYTDVDEWNNAKRRATLGLRQYIKYWRFLLACWVLLYLALFLGGLPIQTLTSLMPQTLGWWRATYPHALPIAATFFNNCNSLAIALCYIVLQSPTVSGSAGRSGRQRPALKGTVVVGLLLIILFTALEILLSSRVVSYELNWLRIADVISGIVGGVSLALFVGRIQSRFLDPPALLPLAFYLYVVIQSLFVSIGDKSQGPLIIEAALILKCLLYLYVAWLYKSGRFLFYLVRMKPLFENVNANWKDFFLNLD